MAEILYKLKIATYPSKKPEKPIHLQISFSRTTRKNVPMDISVAPYQWDHVRERVINHPSAALLNSRLLKKQRAIEALEDEAERACVAFTPEFVDRMLFPEKYSQEELEAELKADPVFSDYMLQALCRQVGIKLSTVEDQMKTQKRFARYFPGLRFSQINYNVLVEFERRCMMEGHARSTIGKHHKNIRKYINQAMKEGVYVYPPGQHPFTNYKPPKVAGKRDFLTERELKKVEVTALPAHLDLYRQMFLFICYTGLRISDFMRLDAGMLREDVLVVRPIKTENTSGAEVHLPLKLLWNGRPWQIWEAFNFRFPTTSTGFDCKFNAALKAIGLALGIPKKISAHVGRHTFLTHLAMKTGNVFHVMNLGGIKKVDTAMIYIHLAEQDNRKFLERVEW